MSTIMIMSTNTKTTTKMVMVMMIIITITIVRQLKRITAAVTKTAFVVRNAQIAVIVLSVVAVRNVHRV